jgi:hypothetical protein
MAHVMGSHIIKYIPSSGFGVLDVSESSSFKLDVISTAGSPNFGYNNLKVKYYYVIDIQPCLDMYPQENIRRNRAGLYNLYKIYSEIIRGGLHATTFDIIDNVINNLSLDKKYFSGYQTLAAAYFFDNLVYKEINFGCSQELYLFPTSSNITPILQNKYIFSFPSAGIYQIRQLVNYPYIYSIRDYLTSEFGLVSAESIFDIKLEIYDINQKSFPFNDVKSDLYVKTFIKHLKTPFKVDIIAIRNLNKILNVDYSSPNIYDLIYRFVIFTEI